MRATRSHSSATSRKRLSIDVWRSHESVSVVIAASVYVSMSQHCFARESVSARRELLDLFMACALQLAATRSTFAHFCHELVAPTRGHPAAPEPRTPIDTAAWWDEHGQLGTSPPPDMQARRPGILLVRAFRGASQPGAGRAGAQVCGVAAGAAGAIRRGALRRSGRVTGPAVAGGVARPCRARERQAAHSTYD